MRTRWDGAGEHLGPLSEDPIRVYADPKLAELRRLEAEREACSEASLIAMAGGLTCATSLTEPELFRYLSQFRIDEPRVTTSNGTKKRDWTCSWWWSRAMRRLEWQSIQDFSEFVALFDKAWFFRIVAIEIER